MLLYVPSMGPFPASAGEVDETYVELMTVSPPGKPTIAGDTT
jgi:hypothetical protein